MHHVIGNYLNYRHGIQHIKQYKNLLNTANADFWSINYIARSLLKLTLSLGCDTLYGKV